MKSKSSAFLPTLIVSIVMLCFATAQAQTPVLSKTDRQFTYAEVVDAGDLAALKALLAVNGLEFDEKQVFPFQWQLNSNGSWSIVSGQTEGVYSYYHLEVRDADGRFLSLGRLRFEGAYMNSYHTNLAFPDPITGVIATDTFDLMSRCRISEFTLSLNGQIPTSIGNLDALTSLSLSGNLTGSIPSTIGNLVNLTSLSLSGNLTGSIPSTIVNLVNLTSLSLYGNLTGSIPSTIGNLVNLTSLRLDGNKLSGLIPDSIGNLVNLTSLDLSSNQLTGAIPSSIGNLVNLTSLELYGNQLTGAIPASIGNLTKLPVLYLSGNLTGEIPSTIGNLVNLTSLDLSSNQLNGSIPSTIGNLVNLTSLSLSAGDYSGNLTGSIPSTIGNLVNLTSLRLDGNKLSGLIPDSIGNLVNLTSLDLSSNQLNGSIPSWIGNLVNLTSLELHGNQLTGAIPSSIANLMSLTSLCLGSNQLSGAIPSTIGNLVNLTSLDLSSNQLTGSIPSTIGNLVNLGAMDLRWNRLSGEIPASIGNLVNLGYLGLSENHLGLSESDNQLIGQIPDSIGNLTKLRYLYLHNNFLSGTIPPSIANFADLFWLRLENNYFDVAAGTPNYVLLNSFTLGKNSLYQKKSGVALLVGKLVKNGAPIATQNIRVSASNNQGVYPWTYTESDGTFYLAVPSNGEWTISVDDLFLTEKALVAGDHKLTVANNQSITGIEIPVFDKTATVSGNLKGANNIPIGGASIYATATIDGIYYRKSTSSDSSGNYSFPVINGIWNVHVSSSGSSGYDVSQGVTVSGSPVQLNFSVTAHLTGRVTKNGVGASGAKITAFRVSDSQTGFRTIWATTGADGSFDLGVTDNGDWHIFVDGAYLTANNLIAPIIRKTLSNSQSIGSIPVPLMQATTVITGSVKDLSGTPLANTNVYSSATSASLTYQSSAKTDSSGNYTLPVFSGAWHVGVSGGLYSSQQVSVNGQPIQVNFVPFVDTTKPVLGVVSPANAAQLIAPVVVFGGTVVETGSKPAIEFSTDGGAHWTAATIPLTSVKSPYAWTANVTLVPGANTVQFRATDLTKNVSAVVSRTVTYTVPQPVVTSPAAGAKLTAGQVSFSGTVPAAGGMPGVELSADAGASWSSASVSGSKAPYAWSANATLSPGANTLLFRTVDALGQRGQPVSRSVTYLNSSTAPLELAAQGSGTFTTGLAGKNLNLNMPYTVTATPKTGMIFKEWLKNGVSFSRNATLTFTMEEELKLEPVFIANPFPAVAGTFNGLVGVGTETDMGAFFVGNGFVTLTPTGTGTFSGSLRLEGQTLPLTGKFDGYGETTMLLKRTGKSAVTVGLKLDLTKPGKVTGTVTGGTTLAFTALPGVFTGVKPSIHPLNLARYTVALPAPDAALGHGYATMVVDAKGLATFAGKLADGTAFTTSARTVDDGIGNWVVPVHIPLYTSFAGMLLGEVVMPKTEPAAAADVAGSLGWLRPANANATMFRSGFLKTLTPQGERYRLTTGLSLLTGNDTTGNFTLTVDPSATLLPAALIQAGAWPASNVPLLPKPVTAAMKLTFTATTGLIKGSFSRTINGKPVSTPYEGAVLATPLILPGGLAPVRAAGFFSTGTASGKVEIIQD